MRLDEMLRVLDGSETVRLTVPDEGGPDATLKEADARELLDPGIRGLGAASCVCPPIGFLLRQEVESVRSECVSEAHAVPPGPGDEESPSASRMAFVARSETVIRLGVTMARLEAIRRSAWLGGEKGGEAEDGAHQ